jgi:hypothetical protein
MTIQDAIKMDRITYEFLAKNMYVFRSGYAYRRDFFIYSPESRGYRYLITQRTYIGDELIAVFRIKLK